MDKASQRVFAFGDFINETARESIMMDSGGKYENPPVSSLDFRGGLGGRRG